MRYEGFPKLGVGPHNKDYGILGSILRSLYLRKLLYGWEGIRDLIYASGTCVFPWLGCQLDLGVEFSLNFPLRATFLLDLERPEVTSLWSASYATLSWDAVHVVRSGSGSFGEIIREILRIAPAEL